MFHGLMQFALCAPERLGWRLRQWVILGIHGSPRFLADRFVIMNTQQVSREKHHQPHVVGSLNWGHTTCNFSPVGCELFFVGLKLSTRNLHHLVPYLPLVAGAGGDIQGSAVVRSPRAGDLLGVAPRSCHMDPHGPMNKNL